MKNKLLKTALLFGFATPICVGLASCNTTSVNKTEEVKATTDNHNEASNPTAKNTTVLNSTKTWVKFALTKDQEDSGATLTGPTMQAGIVGKPFCSIYHPTATLESRQQNYWVYADDVGGKKGNRVRDLDTIYVGMSVVPYFENEVILKNCLTLVALEHSVVSMVNYGGNNPDLHYSDDAFNWHELTPGNSIQILPNKALYLKGNNPNGFSQSDTKYTNIAIAGSVNVLGNVMTLIDDGKGTTTEIPTGSGSHCFTKLFENSTGVRVISSDFLPATTLKPYCYEAMFKGCSTLNAFPSYMLSAATLAKGCYKEMFAGCTTIDEISPSLLTTATTLAEDCYYQMFRGCTALKTLNTSVLPGATLAKGCFTGMFEESGLTSLPVALLPTTDLAEQCYYGMFAGCTGLTDLSTFQLNAKTLQPYCYEAMFYNCTGLTAAPALPAVTLDEGCYYSMFYNCTALTTAPTLGATAMAKDCYNSMFYGAGLNTLPTLPAPTLAESCYENMFRNCKSLNADATITLGAYTLANSCYKTMFYNSNITVAPTIGATTLADYCCYKMFYKCTSLTSSSALPAVTATSWCYREMFGYCTSITAIGNISITNLGGTTVETPLRQMFDACGAVTVGNSGTQFFKCPNTSAGYTSDKVDNMFQGTKGYEETGYTPSSGQTYYYS